MKFNVHGGHNKYSTGASGVLNELTEDRKVKDLVISKLRALGHTVYDCTDDSGTSQNKNLKNIVAKCNAHSVDIDVSIHFNAGAKDSYGNSKTTGTEVYYYSSKGKAYAEKVVNAIAELGFKNRGAKKSTSLYVLKNTNSPAILIECCFVDDKDDANLYNAEKMASAIVKGLTGKTVSASTSNNTSTNTSASSSKSNLYDSWVANLQTELNRQGYRDSSGNKLVVDGINGSKTLSACPTVKKGAKGNITKLIQQRLNSVGFNLNCDGDFGTKTYNAVKTFQKNRGLTQDGIVGKNTWTWLLKGTKM